MTIDKESARRSLLEFTRNQTNHCRLICYRAVEQLQIQVSQIRQKLLACDTWVCSCTSAWLQYIVACQAHPALVKIGLVLARLFHFDSLLVCIRLVHLCTD